MEPIRSRTPSPACVRPVRSQQDPVQPSEGQGVSAHVGGPLDRLPARSTVSRNRLSLSPARLPAFSSGNFGDLLHEVDISFFEALPSLNISHAEAASETLDEVQSALHATDEPQPLGIAAAPQPACYIHDALPSAHMELSALGYSLSQQDQIKPKVRSTVAQHHQVLVGHGFTHAHIVELSKHPAALGTVAARYPDLIAALPEATHEDVVGVGKQRAGARALEILLKLADDLREPPLQLVTGQLLKIAKRGGMMAVQAVHAWRNVLTNVPFHLTPKQVVSIASNHGGKQALETVQQLLPRLCEDHGLTPDQVVVIASNNGGKQALETVQRLLPVLCKEHGLAPDQVMSIASQAGSKQALEMVQQLLPVLCKEHGLTVGQVVAIASHDGGKQALQTVHRLLPVLCREHGLTVGQVVAIANDNGGKQALETVQRLLPVLCNDHGLTRNQVVAIASNRGGKQALETVHRLLPLLCRDHGLTRDHVVSIASNHGGKQALETVQRLLSVLCNDHGLTRDQVVSIASSHGGKQALEAVQRLLPRLCKQHGLTADQVVVIASHDGGKQALETVQRLLPVLCKEHGLTQDQVVAIASNNGGKQALETVRSLLPILCNDHGLTRDQVVAIACNNGGKQALEAVQRLLPMLCKEHGLTPAQVVSLANQDGGKQALETVQRLLPVLCSGYDLTLKQVVAIASKGGKQALETVQCLLPRLCKDHGLTLAQVVAIANNRGSKQALETVQRLLPVLCKDHGLTAAQVVAIASNFGGKQALETVQRLLPVLCDEYGLTQEQVVAIASNVGGRQALQSLLAQLSRPDPALAALSKERLVALACLGGRPALEAVIKGLPHAPTLIRRANRRVPERTSHRVADPAQIVQVLSFFQCHCHPARAFDEAMQQFGMSRSSLLQLFRLVGVTELEACEGTLPSASERWRRILQALGGQRASATAPTPPQASVHALTDSLEGELDASSPMHEVGQALAGSSCKRSRPDDSVNRSSPQPAEPSVPDQPDALHAHLPTGWGVKRSRTKIDRGLSDPGTPTGADLQASSIQFQRRDAASFAGAEHNFPGFDDEEIAWLMELFP